MKRKLSIFSWIVILVAAVIIAVAAVAQPGGPPNGEPPQLPPEAIAACKDKQPGKTCQISTPQGEVAGTCMVMQDQLVCTPEGGPPEGPPPEQ